MLDHGYCRSVYVTDPNGMILEFTYDPPEAEALNATKRKTAHEELARWLKGDHTSNNTFPIGGFGQLAPGAKPPSNPGAIGRRPVAA